MSVTRSSPADRLLLAGWVAFAAANQAVMLLAPSFETVAFHFVWISMSLVYGLQAWSTRRTALILVVVIATTGATITHFAANGRVDWQELTEVPLMALVFLSMVWHVRRRSAALAQTQSLVERERRAQHVKELFVRNCSHEMRTPITVARGFAEMVRAVLPTEASKDDLDVVVDELDKLGGLAGRLLVLAEAYESTEFEWAPVDLGALVQRTIQRWRPSAERAWVMVAPPVIVEGDESRLEAALDSMIENAVKFTVDGDLIALRCRASKGGALLEVEDGGIGFARSRLDDGTGGMQSSGRPGTGLGLAIVRAIAEGHGGALTLFEDREEGALLHIELPLLGAPGQHDGSGFAHDGGRADSGGWSS